MAWGSECRASHNEVGHLQSNQEEADTNMILHTCTLDAKANGATQLQIHSPDTHVCVLALRRYSE